LQELENEENKSLQVQNKNDYDKQKKERKKRFKSQEKEGNHQTSPSNNIMMQNYNSNFSNPQMALNTNRSK
jgi:hypothetical protein